MSWTYVAMRPVPGVAIAHGRELADLQSAAGLATVQGWFESAGRFVGMRGLLAFYYWSQLLGSWVVLLVLAARSRPGYRLARNLVFGTWAVAVCVFWLWPAASPAMTAAGLSGVPWHVGYDVFAAMPSLHVATALTVLLALRETGWRYWQTGCVWVGAIVFTVLATGNHFVLDVLAGAALTGLVYLADRRWARR